MLLFNLYDFPITQLCEITHNLNFQVVISYFFKILYSLFKGRPTIV